MGGDLKINFSELKYLAIQNNGPSIEAKTWRKEMKQDFTKSALADLKLVILSLLIGNISVCTIPTCW